MQIIQRVSSHYMSVYEIAYFAHYGRAETALVCA